jgi:glutathionyl-hydroquinone reductase
MPEWRIDKALATPVGGDGRFRRPPSRFRDQVSSDGSTPYAAEAGRYHLYVSWACPWAHRTVIGRRLKGLEDAIGMSVVDPVRDERSWAFTGGDHVDAVNGWQYLSEAYCETDPDYEGRLSVPVLWDTQTRRIVNNESADILRMFSTGFGDLASGDVDLYPERHRAEIDALNRRLYEEVNNAVYRAGFSRDQSDYEEVVDLLFATLDDMDARLADRRFLFGDEPVETDWRLFTTLVRFDAVYFIHFKCSRRRIVDYAHLWPYARDLYQQPGIADTVRVDEIRAHYYLTHPRINPSGIVAAQPDFDLGAPHDRARLASTAQAARSA